MKIIYNKILPFKGFSAMVLFGVIFARKEYYPLTKRTVRHEEIHAAQAQELGGWLLFYMAYLLFWIEYGYRDNPLEREAYGNDFKKDFLITRQKFNWKKYKL
jgi:hypothetical protein